jgi:hypothetical protein
MASSSDIRKLFKAFSENPAFHAEVRAAKTPAEKHEIIRKAGHTPVKQSELHAEVAKSIQPGAAATPEDAEFVGAVLHLAAADSSDHNSD